MLGKLLKYDMKALWRVWWIILAAVPSIALSVGLVLRMITRIPEDSDFYIFVILGMLFLYLAYFLYVGTNILNTILIYWRFYKNFYTDEGYLTFTLPVSRRTHLLAKTLNAVIWHTLYGTVSAVSFVLLLLLAPSEGINGVVSVSFGAFGDLVEIFGEIWNAIGAWTLVYAFLLLLFLELCTIFSICLIQFCITVGSILVKKAKLIVGVAIYYGVYSVLSTAITILVVCSAIPFAFGIVELAESFTPLQIHAIVILVCLIACAIVAAMSGVIYCMTLNKLERKLNLS